MNHPSSPPLVSRCGSIPTPPRRLLGGLILLLLGLLPSWAAPGAGTGAIEGRVRNAASGNFLNNARVTLEGTDLETQTNDIGEYRFPRVPVGEVRVVVSFAGMQTRTETVRVLAGENQRRDFALVLTGASTEGDVLELERFSVIERELTGQAIALQEQRNAPNIKNVVSLDEFGDMGEGNVGEFMKYVPGLSITYNPQTPSSVSIRGMPATGTLVMTDGAEMASSQDGTRTFELGLTASGNVDRIEVSKVPTPDMPANAVGGSINIISKSGFSRTTPLLSYNAFLTHTAIDGMGHISPSFSKKDRADPLVRQAATRPAYNLSYILPVNRKLAFTFALSQSSRTTDLEFSYRIWDLVRLVQTYHRPSTVAFNEDRELASIGVDWKIGDQHILKASFQATNQNFYTRTHHMVSRLGANYTGNATSSQGSAAGVDSVEQGTNTWVSQYRTLRHGNLSYRFEGNEWHIDANLALSRAGARRKDTEDGFFSSVSANITGLVIGFDGIDGFEDRRSAVITATRGGVPIDPYNGDGYTVNSVNSVPVTIKDEYVRAGLNVRRDFSLALPLSIKVGGAVSRQTKDTRGGAFGYSFLPPGGVPGRLASNFDLIDEGYSAERSFTDVRGNPIWVRWLSPYKVYQLYRQHPEYFTFTAAQQAAHYTSQVNTSKRLQETIPAAYLRTDVKLLRNRLWLSGGVRYEQTQTDGLGPRNDLGATFQRDAAGNFLRTPAGALIRITTDALENAKLQYTERGTRARRTYDDFYPSLNSSFEITRNLLLRAAYAKTIGRPNLNEIIPGMTLPNPDSTAANLAITVINSGLTPWTADNYDLTLELYDVKGATASVSLFRKDIRNFFGSVRTPATPELLAEFGLTEDYGHYDIVTKRNFGEANIGGVELSYRQSLAPLLPGWGRGLQVFMNATSLTLGGANADDFTSFSPHEMSAGISYAHARFLGKVNLQRSGWIRGSRAAASATVPADAYNWIAPQTRVDLSCEYRFMKSLSVYASIRNLLNTPKRQSIRGPGIPSYSEFNYFQYTGSLITLGLKGSF